jgi:hypothetical protein
MIRSRRMRWMGHVACMGDRGDAYRVLVRTPEGKIPLERPRCRWKDNIKMNLQEMGWGVVNWVGRVLLNVIMNLQAP